MSRLLSFFVAPADQDQDPEPLGATARRDHRVPSKTDLEPQGATALRGRPVPAESARLTVVLAAPAIAAAAAGLAAAERRLGATAAVLFWHSGPPRIVLPPRRAAARLAARLAHHGLPARAAGRVVWVALPGNAAEAAAVAAHASITTGARVVLVLAGPRHAAFDDLLERADERVVAVARRSDGPARTGADDAVCSTSSGIRAATVGSAAGNDVHQDLITDLAVAGLAGFGPVRRLTVPATPGAGWLAAHGVVWPGVCESKAPVASLPAAAPDFTAVPTPDRVGARLPAGGSLGRGKAEFLPPSAGR